MFPSGRTDYTFRNWAGIYSAKPKLFFQPTSQEEIIEIVQNARELGRTIVTVGAGHSPNNMCITSDWLLNLDNMNKVYELIERPELHYADVVVDAGIRVRHLNEYLNKHGYTLQNLGSIDEQSVAGMISTGTHGSSPYHGLISSQIVNLTMINGRGEVLFLSSRDNPEIFRAALLSLGKVGIITRATIRVVPKFDLRVTERILTFDELLDRWDRLWTSAEFIRVWWYPYSKKCILWRAGKTEEPRIRPKRRWLDKTLGRMLYEILLWVSCKIYPSLTPYIERFIFNRQYNYLSKNRRGETYVTDSVQGFNSNCLFPQFVNEWSCPMENGPEVLRSLEHSISQASQNGEFFVHAPIEVRCSNATLPHDRPDYRHRTRTSPGPVFGNLLRPYLDNSPSYCQYVPMDSVTNNQLTLHINAAMYRPFGSNTRIYKWFSLFEDTMSVAGGKPHWAMNFIGSPSLACGSGSGDGDVKPSGQPYKDYECRGLGEKIKEWYGPDLLKFKQIRREQDPDDIFVMNKEWAVRNGIVD